MYFFCCTETRRVAVAASPDLNGIDHLEVVDRDAPSPDERQRILRVHFLKPVVGLDIDNVRVDGGERIRNIDVESVEVDATDDTVLVVTVDQYGDFSRYVLRIVSDAGAVPTEPPSPPAGIDPMLSVVEFSFKVECPANFDCAPDDDCPAEPLVQPAIDYLAKDYASFRRLLLDRLALIIPEWTERNAADLGMTLVELLAFVGDHLSYRQDAVATEAYLETARRRTSVRRHARLVDYRIDDGRNARTWVHFEAAVDGVSVDAGTPLLTKVAGRNDAVLDEIDEKATVFELVHDLILRTAHNRIEFHTWGESRCCLPRGAVQATLLGELPHLAPGDVLVFEEVLGPHTGDPADADRSRRHAVRLTSIARTADPLLQVDVAHVTWHDDDALPFPFCVSTVIDRDGADETIDDVSVARGNVALADHGRTVSDDLGAVPEPHLDAALGEHHHCDDREPTSIPPRYAPRLPRSPLTHAPAPGEGTESATSTLLPNALGEPAVSLIDGDGRWWMPHADLLASDPAARHFVAEIERDGIATLRFGDGARGARPASGTSFTATYRVGNGVSGNIGADALAHVVSLAPLDIANVRNPLPAAGGSDPESIEDVRQRAPVAFRRQERAVTEADYAEVTERRDDVQRAVASFRWTGSWRTVFVTVDREGGAPIDDPVRRELLDHIEKYRMAGYDLAIDEPIFVPLELGLKVCVEDDYTRSAVREALLDLFSSRERADGTRGVFHADELTFGKTVYLSPLQAAAQKIPGVCSVRVTKFRRQGDADSTSLDDGFITLDRLEIARLDNDPSFPEHGVLELELGGGR